MAQKGHCEGTKLGFLHPLMHALPSSVCDSRPFGSRSLVFCLESLRFVSDHSWTQTRYPRARLPKHTAASPALVYIPEHRRQRARGASGSHSQLARKPRFGFWVHGRGDLLSYTLRGSVSGRVVQCPYSRLRSCNGVRTGTLLADSPCMVLTIYTSYSCRHPPARRAAATHQARGRWQSESRATPRQRRNGSPSRPQTTLAPLNSPWAYLLSK